MGFATATQGCSVQPQWPARVNWANPITSQLAFAVIPLPAGGSGTGSRDQFWDACGNPLTVSAATFTKTHRMYGLGAVASAGNRVTVNCGSLTTQYTLFAVLTSGTTTEEAIDNDGATRCFQWRLANQLLIPFSSGGVPDTTNVLWVGSGLPAGKAGIGYTAAASVPGQNGILLMLDGAIQSFNSTIVPRAPTQATLFGREVGGNDLTGALHLACAWRRALSKSELLSLSANPWQIFAAPR